ncbi:MAG TPA: hypothetical protein RMF84_10595, partial [Polyangiaceae bacterium LLY-WYZ-14_1]|nr:hypothetical protein [Polyangiaceae bacterium LLY-WYZ-14_1]
MKRAHHPEPAHRQGRVRGGEVGGSGPEGDPEPHQPARRQVAEAPEARVDEGLRPVFGFLRGGQEQGVAQGGLQAVAEARVEAFDRGDQEDARGSGGHGEAPRRDQGRDPERRPKGEGAGGEP